MVTEARWTSLHRSDDDKYVEVHAMSSETSVDRYQTLIIAQHKNESEDSASFNTSVIESHFHLWPVRQHPLRTSGSVDVLTVIRFFSGGNFATLQTEEECVEAYGMLNMCVVTDDVQEPLTATRLTEMEAIRLHSQSQQSSFTLLLCVLYCIFFYNIFHVLYGGEPSFNWQFITFK